MTEWHGSKIFEGMGTSIGIVEGTAVVISRAMGMNPTSLEEGQILVTTMTTPDLVGMMHDAAAIVTSRGGRLCHAAIVSREFRVPCVVGVQQLENCLSWIDGKRIRVDGKAGTVEVIADGS